MEARRSWNWNRRQLHQLHLTRSPQDQFQDDWQSWRCCSCIRPLLPPIRALAQWASVAGVGLCRPGPLPSVAGLGSKATFPFHQPCLFIGFWWVGSQTQTLSISFWCLRWGCWADSRVFLNSVEARTTRRDGCEEPPLLAHRPRGGGLRETFLAAAETTCFREPPRFSPALQGLPAYSLPCWSRNMLLDELTSSKAEQVHWCAPG